MITNNSGNAIKLMPPETPPVAAMTARLVVDIDIPTVPSVSNPNAIRCNPPTPYWVLMSHYTCNN